MVRWIIFLGMYAAFGFYTFQALRTVTKNQWIYALFILSSLLVVGNFVYQFSAGDTPNRVFDHGRSMAFGFLIANMAFYMVAIFFMFSEDIVRFLTAIYSKLFGASKEFSIPSRRKFVSTIALGIAALPFGALLFGMYKGKYNFKVLDYVLEFDDLPEAFDGYKITQISDVHSGSFDDREKVAYGVDLINKQKSDVILFTGDMVNNRAVEMEPWASLFTDLQAKDGKYSILGNHDYGDYVQWGSKAEKEANLERLMEFQKEMGFDLLLNENRYLKKGEDKIALVGVENWGKGGFKKAGDLKKAASGIAKEDFKILMSHDPSHWEEEVVSDDYHYHLTLSGHTHGMQFGIEIPGWFKLSPVRFRYKYWAGIYEELGQFINVNRGFGFIGYPGRFGIWPEITVITLKKKDLA